MQEESLLVAALVVGGLVSFVLDAFTVAVRRVKFFALGAAFLTAAYLVATLT